MISLFSVTLTYHNLPKFSCTVYARDEGNAERIGADEAVLKGWPRKFLSITVSKVG